MRIQIFIASITFTSLSTVNSKTSLFSQAERQHTGPEVGCKRGRNYE